MCKKGIFSQNRLVLIDNFGQIFSKYDHFCIEIGQNRSKKEPQSKLSKTAGKTATRRTPKKTAEAYENPQGFRFARGVGNTASRERDPGINSESGIKWFSNVMFLCLFRDSLGQNINRQEYYYLLHKICVLM